jgi:capsular polysaccharide biosynthesis protein
MAEKPSLISDEEIVYDEGNRIDFGKYIETLIRQWQLIVMCALGLGILAFVISKFINHFSPSYQAVALVASAQTESSVNFGSDITSATDVQLAQAAGSTFYDRATRLQSFVSQAQNGAVAEQVLQELGSVLIDKKGKPIAASDLLGMVDAGLIPKTDTIQISVTYDDPAIAAEIVNAWAKDYVQRVNDLYSVSSSGTSYQATETEVARVKSNYDKAQAALTDFIALDKTAAYTRQIDEITSTITILRKARSDVGNSQVDDHLEQIDAVYSQSRMVGYCIDTAISMRAAVQAGGDSAAISNSLALTMLKAEIYAGFEGTNTLQVQNLPEALGSSISTVNAAGMVADLDALISTLETTHTELNKKIDTLSSEVLNEDYLMNFSHTNTPIDKRIEENEQKIRDLNYLISAQTSTLGELTEARDLAWKSYSALATKATEMSVNPQNIQLVLASPATPPTAKTLSVQMNAILGTGVGLLIGIIVAYAYEFWQSYKRRNPKVITKTIFTYAKNLVSRSSVKSRKP